MQVHRRLFFSPPSQELRVVRVSGGRQPGSTVAWCLLPFYLLMTVSRLRAPEEGLQQVAAESMTSHMTSKVS